MFSRLFTLTERISSLLITLSVRLGNEWLSGITNVGTLLRFRRKNSREISDVDRVQGQVRSLSGLIIGLMAAVVLLLLWATSPQSSVFQVIEVLIPGTPAAVSDAVPPNILGGQNPNIDAEGGPLQSGDTVAFTMRVNGQDDIYAIRIGEGQPIRLTDHAADDRDPAFSPDGQTLAFASHRDGNWELYTLDIPSGEITRLTFDLAYQAAPSWSPDGLWVAYEGYADNNLDIYIIRVDGTEGPFRLTFDPAPDYEPAWSTSAEGRQLAYVSWRDGNQEVYLLSLDDPREEIAINVTTTSDIHEESPAWSTGGLLLAYSANLNGTALVFAKQTNNLSAEGDIIGQGYAPDWSPHDASVIYASQQSTRHLLLAGQYSNLGFAQEAVGLPAPATDPTWTAAALPRRLRGSIEQAATAPVIPHFNEALRPPGSDADAPYRPINLEGIDAISPFLSDRVNDSFVALRKRIEQEAGWDFLGRSDHIWWDIDRPIEPGQSEQNWHKAGRAFDISQGYIEGQSPLVLPVLELNGADVYWRLYARAAQQDGSQGEPLHALPWDFEARWSGDVDAYDNGGRFYASIPSGYFVDITLLAADYGWVRTSSDNSWRSNWPGVLFWQYEKRDQLDWWDAMLELYNEEQLTSVFTAPPSSGTQ